MIPGSNPREKWFSRPDMDGKVASLSGQHLTKNRSLPTRLHYPTLYTNHKKSQGSTDHFHLPIMRDAQIVVQCMQNPYHTSSMKRFSASFLLLSSALLFFPGCLGLGEDEETTSSEMVAMPFYRIVKSDDFALQVPEDWETIQEFSSDYPTNTVVAFRNNIEDHDFIANVNIVDNEVEEGTTSSEYALAMIETLESQLLNYQQNAQEEITLWVGETEVSTYLTEFEGTNDGGKPVRQFIQLYAVNGAKAFIVTGTYDADDTELAIDQVKQTVKSFRLN